MHANRKSNWKCRASLAAVMALAVSAGCDDGLPPAPSGTLSFQANGESFARDGFTSKDGWDITFAHVYVCVSGPTAIQVVESAAPAPKLLTPMHAGHSHIGVAGGLAHETLAGEYVVDLAQGTAATEIGALLVGIGNYNRLSFGLKKATADAVAVAPMTDAELDDVLGLCVVLVGTATDSTDTVAFTLKFGEELFYMSTAANGDVGLVADGGAGAAEMTFHFDHIFGDDTLAVDDPLNLAAGGFQPFRDIATDLGSGVDFEIAATFEQMKQLLPPAEMLWLYRAYLTLGHTGEEHCMFIPGLPGGEEEAAADEVVYTGQGDLAFQANGEGFARDGFKSMDDWDVSFSAVVVNVSNPAALAITTEGTTEVKLDAQSFAIDLTDPPDRLVPVVYDTQTPVDAGDYNRVTWEHHRIELTDANANVGVLGDYVDQTFVLEGTATGSTGTVHFTIKINAELAYSAAGPHPDGIGVVTETVAGAAECTFHFDHIFGDFGTLGEPDSVNEEARGFGPIADLAVAGVVDLTIDVSSLATLGASLPAALSGPDLFTFYKAFLTLGHCGEEHCFVMLH